MPPASHYWWRELLATTDMTKHNAVWTDEMVNRDEAFDEDDVDEELDHYWDYTGE